MSAQVQAIKAIPTYYHDTLFRSRLEARWAVFFDALGIEWQYEAEGWEIQVEGRPTRYLCDFWLPNDEIWVEIKRDNLPDEERNAAWRKICALGLASGSDATMCEGLPADAWWPLSPDGCPQQADCTSCDASWEACARLTEGWVSFVGGRAVVAFAADAGDLDPSGCSDAVSAAEEAAAHDFSTVPFPAGVKWMVAT